MGHTYDYLDSRVIKKLQGKRLVIRRVFDGVTSGMHGSRTRGYNVEFSQHRDYFPGDDIKNIDWRLFGRRERLFIKEFEEDTNYRVLILVDCSRSMDFSSGEHYTKLEYAKRIASHISYFFLKQKDMVGLGFYDNGLRTFLPPKAGAGRVHFLIDMLQKLRPGATTDLDGSLRELLPKLKRRGLIVVVSDFLEPGGADFNMLRVLVSKRMPVIAVLLNDPLERSLELDRFREFRDPESGEKLRADPVAVRASYQAAFREHCLQFHELCRTGRIASLEAVSNDPLEETVLAILRAVRKDNG